MTDGEWLEYTDPQKMLEFLRGKASDRKFRLCAVACCRLIWHLLSDERSRNAVEVAERFADGIATETERTSALVAAKAAIDDIYPAYGDYAASAVANALSIDASALISAKSAAFVAAVAADDDDDRANELKWNAERVWQSSLLRDIFGNPFRPVTLSPAVLAWNDGVVVRLAKAAYEERIMPEGTLDKSLLAILADALEEAGCTDKEILGHLRGPGPHVRGCWPVDLCLGKS